MTKLKAVQSLFLLSEWETVFPHHSREKCASKFKVGMGEEMNKRVECERKCLEKANCHFYFFSDNRLCILYSEFNNYTKKSHIGRSYHKTGNDI